MPIKKRLDLYLVDKGLAATRQQAQQLIRAGKVRDKSGQLLDKPGHLISRELELKVKEEQKFVSRGGEKLFRGLKEFPIKVQGRICLDAGISTGGFTDCLLQHGAARVYGIDVGYGQTAWKLRNDRRVILKERTNLRTLTPSLLYKANDPYPTLAVADLSFISLRLVLPVIKSLLDPVSPESLLLVKPQFEVGRGRVGKGGVVRDPIAHVEVLNTITSYSRGIGWSLKGLVGSPLKGPAGNHEYLIWLSTEPTLNMPDIEKVVMKTMT